MTYRLLVLSLGRLACAPDTARDPAPGASSDPDFRSSAHLVVWATDADSVDLNFLAVLDADPTSATYAEVLTTLPVPTQGRTRGHHTEHRMPDDQRLFANDFGTGKTYIFDLTDPLAPQLADSFTTAGLLSAPHSFERLANGNVLATFQSEGAGNTAPGGIAELDPRGATVQWGSAATGGDGIQPYSLAVAESIDRVVTGSADVRGDVDSRAVQIWRLSDLALLATLSYPDEWGLAAEPRGLADGKTVLVTTFGCKLLRVVGLETDAPTMEMVYDFGGASCALPVVAGDFWVQAVPQAHGLVALDVSTPSAPAEVSRVVLDEDDWPHWIALSPNKARLVMTGYAGTRHRVVMIHFDTISGALQVDSAFTSADASRPGVTFDRPSWPHGESGPADPHGAVFSRVRK